MFIVLPLRSPRSVWFLRASHSLEICSNFPTLQFLQACCQEKGYQAKKKKMQRRLRHKLKVGLIVLLFFAIYTIWPGYDVERRNTSVKNEATTNNVPEIPLSLKKAQRYIKLAKKCSNYADYASIPHYRDDDDGDDGDDDNGKSPLDLPFQRPPENCRTFRSELIESVIKEFKRRIKDRDLAKLFENTFPNTLDTTILWHVTGEQNSKLRNHRGRKFDYRNEQPETFVVTGDIHAEWLRDSAWQLSVYQPFIKHDKTLRELIKGAINTQAQLIISNPYCNAFHPPPYTQVQRGRGAIDQVYPEPNWGQVFECKYEIDSLASFLTLSRQFYENAPDDEKFSFINNDWIAAMSQLLTVLSRESVATFDEEGFVNRFYYVFQRDTNVASETLPLAGTGNPVNYGIGLVRSAFRPSDDSTIFQFFIPGNAHMSVELEHISQILGSYYELISSSKMSVSHKYDGSLKRIIDAAAKFSQTIRTAIMDHAIAEHPEHGLVFAYEIDGYGSRLFMDDANIPSLLSLPDIGFISKSDQIYQNTRKLVLSKKDNPYFMKGTFFEGIGGPHVGIHNAWPLSLIMRIRTTDVDSEIQESLDMIMKNTAKLGLIHESIQVFVPDGTSFTRPWFAWANSEFAKTILQLAERKPHLIFKEEYQKEKFNLQEFLDNLDV